LLRLDVDTLNEQLQHSGATRLRHAIKPDEAHGCIFNFDLVVADIAAVQLLAWAQLAEQKGLPFASTPARHDLLLMSPEQVWPPPPGQPLRHPPRQRVHGAVARLPRAPPRHRPWGGARPDAAAPRRTCRP
jgi:hypothetical protein